MLEQECLGVCENLIKSSIEDFSREKFYPFGLGDKQEYDGKLFIQNPAQLK
jgi:hypothetical protein